MTLNVKDFIVDHEGLRRDIDKALFIRPERLQEMLLVQLVQKLVPGVYEKGGGNGQDQQQQGSASSSNSRPPQREIYPPAAQPIPPFHHQPPPMHPFNPINPIPGLRNPFNIGDQDLDPLGIMQPPRPGGGMYAGPDHPMFGREGGVGQGGGNGILPPGAVPPGARFDPITPFGEGSGNVPLRPGPRRDPYGGGVLPFGTGEPDNDDFYPPGIGDDEFGIGRGSGSRGRGVRGRGRGGFGGSGESPFQPPYM